jgi:hypothetical protein
MTKVYAFTGTSAGTSGFHRHERRHERRSANGPCRRKARMHSGAMPGLQHLLRGRQRSFRLTAPTAPPSFRGFGQEGRIRLFAWLIATVFPLYANRQHSLLPAVRDTRHAGPERDPQ